jgi:hypothetical protein
VRVARERSASWLSRIERQTRQHPTKIAGGFSFYLKRRQPCRLIVGDAYRAIPQHLVALSQLVGYVWPIATSKSAGITELYVQIVFGEATCTEPENPASGQPAEDAPTHFPYEALAFP